MKADSERFLSRDAKSRAERFLSRDAKARAEIEKKLAANKRRGPHRNKRYEDTGEICAAKFGDSDDEIFYKVI
ncbi:unnamed protein product [Toxocara canis]|uniref:Plasmid stabilization protein n=1 Tax=Toxocara canis TaxID=6265 RepID=A0A183TY05_TOXCA|nr:unnamed protein product [Toxocara canis]